MIELVGYTNKITGEFLVILALLGLVSFFIAYIYVKFTEKRNLENYYFYIFGTGFLLVVITQLMVSLRSISPLLIGLGFVTYFPGIFIAFVLPGLFIKNNSLKNIRHFWYRCRPFLFLTISLTTRGLRATWKIL